jgi:EAL domain-containing protein (putative c-di-GMP-specific phosphodiesterase class I)
VATKPLLLDIAAARSTRKSRRRLPSIEIATLRPVPKRDRLGEVFDRALDGLWMAFQPIVGDETKPAFAYEALLRSHEPAMSTPAEVLTAAEELGRLDELGQRVRALSATAFPRAPDDALLFVNLHSHDLLDPSLYDANAPLASLVPRVVLELTERAPLDRIQDVGRRLSILRFNGFRVAVDDLGAGHAGLASFATVEPEFVKLDMSLVRDLDTTPVQRRLVSSLLDACRDLKTRVIAEGVETEAELNALRELGCELFQGFYFGRPSDSFALPPRRASSRSRGRSS